MSGKFEVGAMVRITRGAAEGAIGTIVAPPEPSVEGPCWAVNFPRRIQSFHGARILNGTWVRVAETDMCVISPPGDSLLTEDEAPAPAAKEHKPVHAGFPAFGTNFEKV